MEFTPRQKLGALALDLPRFVWAMRPGRSTVPGAAPWVYFCNRNEQLIIAGDQPGAACNWQWTSELHIARVFPSIGLILMRKALRHWPITLCSQPERKTDDVDVSFIIGHRGLSRLPHLLLTLQSIAAQQEIAFECIVVEQSSAPEIQTALPDWVRYVHTPLPRPGMPYARSWAFNVGARMARGALLILHDGDLLVPRQYGYQLMALYRQGHEVINLKRFIFYLTEAHTRKTLSGGNLLLDESPEAIIQNAEGGGSIAMARDSYFAIGGFDESFIGWGGEDNEFWDRARTRSVWTYGFLPLVHLWHEAQPGKRAVNGNGLHTASLTEERLAIPPSLRIRMLRSRRFGELAEPDLSGLSYTPDVYER